MENFKSQVASVFTMVPPTVLFYSAVSIFVIGAMVKLTAWVQAAQAAGLN